MKVAYIMSRFPNLTETFVLNEIVALERQDVTTSVYPLIKTRQRLVHTEAVRIAERAHYHPFLSLCILFANAYFLFAQPRKYFGVLLEVLRGTWGSVNFFIGTIGIFPKAVRFAYEMAGEGVTHVHAHFANHPAVAALIIHRLTGIPFSFTGHGHDVHIERRMLDKKCAAAAFAVMISRYNKELVLSDFPHIRSDKIHVLYSGVDTRKFSPPERRESSEVVSILCVGSLIEVKGHLYLVKACRLLKERGVRFVCNLVGSGADRSCIESEIRSAELEDHFVLHGALTNQGVVKRLHTTDVMVQPSVWTKRGSREGIPVSLIEGMASGLPVVASELSGIPELVVNGETGFLVPPRDEVALADALEKLINDPGVRRQFGDAGRRRVRESFDLDQNASKLIDLIRDVSFATKTRPCEDSPTRGGVS